MSAVVAGVDCHKDSHVVAVLDEVGRVVAELTADGPDACSNSCLHQPSEDQTP